MRKNNNQPAKQTIATRRASSDELEAAMYEARDNYNDEARVEAQALVKKFCEKWNFLQVGDGAPGGLGLDVIVEFEETHTAPDAGIGMVHGTNNLIGWNQDGAGGTKWYSLSAVDALSFFIELHLLEKRLGDSAPLYIRNEGHTKFLKWILEIVRQNN